MAYTDFSSDYMSYEGYGSGYGSSSMYPTQDAYDSIYGQGQGSYGSGGKQGGRGRGRGGRGGGGQGRGAGQKRGGGGRGGGGQGRGGGAGQKRGGGGWGGGANKSAYGGSGGWGGGGRGYQEYDDTYGYETHEEAPKKKKKKAAPTDDFHCEMCDVTANNEDTFQTHLVGTRHLTNLEKLEKGEKLVKGSKKKRQTGQSGGNINLMSLDEVITASTEPLIGLEFITLDSVDNPEGYFCEGCQSRMNIGNVIAHLTGGRHRENYIMKNPRHATYASEIKAYTEELEMEERSRMEQKKAQGEEPESDEVYPKRSLINKKLQHFATIIEEQYGREKHKVAIDHAAEAKKKRLQRKKRLE